MDVKNVDNIQGVIVS